MENQEIKIDCATIKLIKKGIIENVIHDYVTLDYEQVAEIRSINQKLSDGVHYAVLVDSGLYTSITKEARELSASKEFSKTTLAKALLVRNMGHRLVGQIYIKMNKPHIKTKIFSNREKAIKWLNSQILKKQ